MSISASHFVFSESFGGSLRRALKQAGRDDPVFCLADDLGCGPINPPDPAARFAWANRELMAWCDEADSAQQLIRDFWAAALASSGRRIVWVAKRVVRDYSGFLEWVWRMRERPFDVFEFEDAEVVYRWPERPATRCRVNSLALLTADHLQARHDWDFARPFEAPERDRCRAIWDRLRRENSPLRILDESGLRSAPLSHFDELMLSCAIESWRKVARIVGEALMKIRDGPFVQTGDFLLHARIIALADAGRLEARGDLAQARFSEVRLPANQAPAPSEA